MPFISPRRDWHSSMTVPTNSLGVRIVALTTGSRTSLILPAGNSLGLVTRTSVRSSMVTSYSTFGAVEIRSRPNSRSSRSRTISRCNSPRKPTRKPKPSATDVSGS